MFALACVTCDVIESAAIAVVATSLDISGVDYHQSSDCVDIHQGLTAITQLGVGQFLVL